MFNKIIYSRYQHIKERCYNPHCKGFVNYGQRGIKMCDEWYNDYHTFEEWCLSHGFKQELQIDRINNDGDYSPENCQFVTPRENYQHRRSTVWITIHDETKNLEQWCEFYGISRGAVYKRLSKGMDIVTALTTPVKSHQRDKTRLINQVFGRLTVIDYAGDEYVEKGRNSRWLCSCICGNTTVVDERDLIKGATQSCGCLKTELLKQRMKGNKYALIYKNA